MSIETSGWALVSPPPPPLSLHTVVFPIPHRVTQWEGEEGLGRRPCLPYIPENICGEKGIERRLDRRTEETYDNEKGEPLFMCFSSFRLSCEYKRLYTTSMFAARDLIHKFNYCPLEFPPPVRRRRCQLQFFTTFFRSSEIRQICRTEGEITFPFSFLFTISVARVAPMIRLRRLSPTCSSSSFPFHLVSRIRVPCQEAKAKSKHRSRVLSPLVFFVCLLSPPSPPFARHHIKVNPSG